MRARGLMLLLTQALSYAKVPPGMLPAKEVLPSRSPMLVRLCNSLHVSFVAHAPPSSSWSLYLSPHSHLPLCLHLSLSLSRLCDSVRPLSVLCDQSLTYSLNEPKGTQRARAACAVIGFWSCYGVLMVPWAARRRCAHAREQMSCSSSSSSSSILLLLLLLPPPPPPPLSSIPLVTWPFERVEG